MPYSVLSITNRMSEDKVDWTLLDAVAFDEESTAANRHLLPRMVGGGRKAGEGFRYKCQWCSSEKLNHGCIGRFNELKNYR